MQRLFAVILTVIVLFCGGCATRSHGTEKKSNVSTPAADKVAHDAIVFRLNATRSQLHILVYRGGPFARLGHNHVVSSKNLSGSVWLSEQLASCGFDIMMPVADLIVDDPNDRKAEGEQFGAAVPEEARDGTRKNMLKPEQLDGESFPRISLHAVSVGGSFEMPVIMTRVELKDQIREIPVTATVSLQGNELTATGEFDLKQSDFGITPFSFGMGALQVVDTLHIKFRLVADKP
jgi:YceI-like domain